MKKIIISGLLGVMIGIAIFGEVLSEKKQSTTDKHLALFLMMNQWVKIKQEGKNIAPYLETRGYKRVAIYGMSYVGKTLVDELKNTNITVEYGIDKNMDSIYADIDIVSPDAYLDSVDVIIVTAITFFEEIEKRLSKKIKCPIISLEDVLYEV